MRFEPMFVARCAWWLTTLCLGYFVFGIVYFAWSWAADPLNALRHEALIGMTMAAFYAALPLLLLGLISWRRAHLLKRVDCWAVKALAFTGLAVWLAVMGMDIVLR